MLAELELMPSEVEARFKELSMKSIREIAIFHRN